jgi:hypothetical protein
LEQIENQFKRKQTPSARGGIRTQPKFQKDESKNYFKVLKCL